jgi:hypothetical protein
VRVGDREIHVEGRLVRRARLAADGYEFLDDAAGVLDGLRGCGTRIDLFTFVQELPDTVPEHGHAVEWDNVAAVPVTTVEHWRSRQVTREVRKALRRAERRGVTVREVELDDALVHGISAVYNECPVRRGRPFPHYGKSAERVRRDNATLLDRSVFLGAFLGDELIGFAKLVAARQQAGLMQIISMVRHRDKAPTNALIARAVRICAERDIAYLVYGKFTYGRKGHDSLTEFKRRNGFERFEVVRYHVPLTRRGRAALALGLPRGLAARVPEVVRGGLRRARRLWYEGPARAVEEAP